MAGWHHQLTGHEFEWAPGVGDVQGGLACCDSWGRRVGHDWVTELNWTEHAMSDNLSQHSGRITVLKLSSYLLFTEGSFTSVCTQLLRHVQVFENPQTVACQFPLSMGFSRQESWSGLPFTSPGGLPSPGIKPASCISCVSSIGRWLLYH